MFALGHIRNAHVFRHIGNAHMFRQVGSTYAFQDLGGAVSLWTELREMHIDSSNVLAVLDSWEVIAIASGLSQIDHIIMMTRMGLQSNIECGATNVMN